MSLIYQTLADLVVVFHFLFIVFVVLGAVLALRWRWVPWLHLPAAAWGAMVAFTGWICPLTPLENWLRQAGGAAGSSQGFIERYLLPLIYPGELTRELQVVLGCGVVVINAAIYFIVWRRAHRSPAGSL